MNLLSDGLHRNASNNSLELLFTLAARPRPSTELEEIDAFCRSVPEVLAVRLQIYQGMAKWDLMEALAPVVATAIMRARIVAEMLDSHPFGVVVSGSSSPTIAAYRMLIEESPFFPPD